MPARRGHPARRGRPAFAEDVAGADGAQAPQLADLPGGEAAPGTAGPRSKTLIAVTRPSRSPPNRSWSRVRTVPENIRA
jgi:hypothetical protein